SKGWLIFKIGLSSPSNLSIACRAEASDSQCGSKKVAEKGSGPTMAQKVGTSQLPDGVVSRCGTAAIAFLALLSARLISAQTAIPSPDRVWNSPFSQQIRNDAKRFRGPVSPIDPLQTYTLAELIDLAEQRNPETRLAWERARAQLAAWGIAR